MRNIFLLTLFFILPSCQTWVADYLPERADKEMPVDKDASSDFKQGWHDGCEVGMSAGSNTFYKSFYHSNAADGYKMAESLDYKTAWGNGFWYCYRVDYIKQKSSIWGAVFTGAR